MASTSNRLLPYTGAPGRLALQDLALFLRITLTWPIQDGLPSIVLPFYPFKSGSLDELYPSIPNLWAIFLHIVLIISQLSFILALIPSVLIGIPVPFFGWTPTCIIILVGVVFGNNAFTVLINGTKEKFESMIDPNWEPHDDEKWIFVNGVAVGSHWMQSNLDRLACTFRRPVEGIHNKTRGIIFDVIEVIIQRTFGYVTPDVRQVYSDILEHIEEQKDGKMKYKKIVLILHSQGAVEGGLVLDWLFATASQEALQAIEVYTFGSAANHFNSPEIKSGKRVIKHIEHYANLGDYVSLFGILNFRPLPWKVGYQSAEVRKELRDRYVGRLFVRKGSGHQMNGNYLDNFFEMSTTSDGKLLEVKEDNAYMSAELNASLLQKYDVAGMTGESDIWFSEASDSKNTDKSQIKDVSRLWLYRNGMSPRDD